MSDWRARRRPQRSPSRPKEGRTLVPTLFFDLGSPWTYLAAERADRMLPGLRWRPASGDALAGAAAPDHADPRVRVAVERRAHDLGLPVVWPDTRPADTREAMRVAALADEHGRAAPFVLAATRLAFCGGYDLRDPEILAEAAAAAGLDLGEALCAAGHIARDHDMELAALRLLRLGADMLPAVIVGRLLFAGERRLPEAVAAAAAPVDGRRRALR